MDQGRGEVQRIEEARKRLARDLEAVSRNADPKNYMSGRIGELRDRVADVRDKLQKKMRDVQGQLPLGPRDKTVPLLLAAVVAGCILGMLLPIPSGRTKRMMPMPDERPNRPDGHVIKDTLQTTVETTVTETGWDLG